jgi:hypothetical protein
VARKNVADAAKAKAEKQKKIVIGLGVVLALAMAYAVHTMMSMNKSDASSKPQVAATTTGSTPAPAAATPSALPAAPSLGAVATPSAAATGVQSTNLVNAVQPPADSGQLQSFSLFESKDPFHSSGPSSGSGGGTSSGGSSGGGTSKPPKSPPAPPTAPATSAVISVNGVSESVTSGGNFPAANPLFQLVSVTGSSARISVVGGTYATGSPTLTLRVNKPVTLANTADGTRYTLTLQPQGTVAAAPSAASPSASTPTATTGG